jgi:hypothetical protein
MVSRVTDIKPQSHLGVAKFYMEHTSTPIQVPRYSWTMERLQRKQNIP